MRSRTASTGLCALSLAAVLVSCSSQKPGGDDSTQSPANPSTKHLLQELVADLMTASGGQGPVEPTEPAPAAPPAPPEPEPAAGDAEAAEICPPETGPVTVLVLPNAHAVRRAAAQYADEPILYRDAETVIFETGRVITSKVDAAGDRLNELGWGGRPLQLLGSMPPRYASAGGNDARSSSGNQKKPAKKKKKRRRG